MTAKAISFDAKVEVTGALFQLGGEPFNDAIRGAVRETTEKGAISARIRASRFSKSGRYAAAIKGKTTKKGFTGRIKAYGGSKKMGYAVVHERGRFWPTTGHRFAGYHVLEATKRDVDAEAPRIFQRHVDDATEKYNR